MFLLIYRIWLGDIILMAMSCYRLTMLSFCRQHERGVHILPTGYIIESCNEAYQNTKEEKSH